MSGFVSYRTIYDVVCPVSRAVLNQWVDEGKVATCKVGTSKQHGRTFLLADVKRCWEELADKTESDDSDNTKSDK